jgi:hypothetical protein
LNEFDREGIEAVRFQLRTVEAKVDLLLERDGVRKQTLDDHEFRVRSLERWKYAIPVSILGIIVAVVVKVATG